MTRDEHNFAEALARAKLSALDVLLALAADAALDPIERRLAASAILRTHP